MEVVVLDLETYFSDDYTLKKMSTEAYIRDPRFKAHGAAIKWSENTSAQWYDERQLRYILTQHDWSDTFLIHHHAQFDGLILSHHYDVHPKMFGCTLSMARLLLGNHLSVSLDAVRKHFGITMKTTPYNLFRGKQWAEMDQGTQRLIAEGACDEVESIWKIFGLFYKDFPVEELSVIDATVKMFTEPCLEGDVELLAKVWVDEATRKAARMAELNVSEADLQSSEKFATLLRAEGVEPETKEGKKKSVYCFAKTDEFMRGLQEHDNDRVRTLAEARLGAKSTLMQTRAETLGFMATRGPRGSRSTMPVYLRYCGAHTTRWSGGDGCLTADTQILTLDIHGTPSYKNIVDVLLTDLVWDGDEFVEHDGVKFSGYHEVISWDGVNGTPDHQVYCGEKSKSLSEALRTKTAIVDCREPTAWEVEAGRSLQRSRADGALRVCLRNKSRRPS